MNNADVVDIGTPAVATRVARHLNDRFAFPERLLKEKNCRLASILFPDSREDGNPVVLVTGLQDDAQDVGRYYHAPCGVAEEHHLRRLVVSSQ